MITIGELRGIISLQDNFSAGLASAKKGIAGFAESFGAITGATGLVAGAIGATTAAIIALGERGSAIADVSDSFDQLSRAAGSSGDAMLGALQRGTLDTISNFELMKTANAALSTGMVQSAADMETLAAGAKLLGYRTGTDTAEAFKTLTNAMASGRTGGLKQLGLFADTDVAVKKFADSLGVSVGDLTDHQRATAASAGIVAGLKKELDAAGPASLGFADNIARGKTAVTNFVDSLSVAIATSPVVKAGMEAMGKAIQDAFGGSQQDSVKTLMGLVNQFAISVVQVGQVAVTAAEVIVGAFEFAKVGLNATLEAITSGIGKAAGLLAGLAEKAAALPVVGQAFTGLATGIRATADSANSLAFGFGEVKDAAIGTAGTALESLGAFKDGLAGAEAEMRKALAAGDGLATSSKDVATGLREIGEAASETTKKIAAMAAEYAKTIGAGLLAEQAAKAAAIRSAAFSDIAGLSAADLDKIQKDFEALGEAGKDAWDEVRATYLQYHDVVILQSTAFKGILPVDEMKKYESAVMSALMNNEKATEELDKQFAAAVRLAEAGSINDQQFQSITESLYGATSATESAGMATQDWSQNLADAAHMMEVLGVQADSFVGRLIGGLAAAGAAGAQLGEGLGKAFAGRKFDLKNLDVGSLIQGIAGVVGAFNQATDSASGFKRALGGAMVGAQAASAIANALKDAIPVIGGLVKTIIIAGGAVVGGLIGLFKKPDWAKAAEEAGKVLGVKLSKELAKEIEKTSKDLKITFGDAGLLMLDKAVAESGKSWHSFADAISSTFALVAKGGKVGEQAIEQIGKAWAGVRQEAEKAGTVGDKLTRQMLEQARAAGALTDEMKSFLRSRGEMAASGAALLIGLLPATIEQAQALAKNFTLAFDTAVGELGFVGAADKMRESFAQIQEQLAETFGQEFVDQAFGPLARVFDMTAEGSPFRGAAQAVDGLTQIFTAAADTGRVTAESFSNMGISAENAFVQAMAAGATQAEALGLIKPLLDALVSASGEYGITLDANTQALVDQAKAAGLAFREDPMIRAADAMDRVAMALDKAFNLGLDLAGAFDRVGASAQYAAAAASQLGDYAPGTPGVPPGEGGPRGVPEFQHGTFGFQDFGRGTLAMLHDREAVVTPTQAESVGGVIAGMVREALEGGRPRTGATATPAGPSGGDVYLDGEQVGRWMARRQRAGFLPAPA